MTYFSLSSEVWFARLAFAQRARVGARRPRRRWSASGLSSTSAFRRTQRPLSEGADAQRGQPERLQSVEGVSVLTNPFAAGAFDRLPNSNVGLRQIPAFDVQPASSPPRAEAKL